MVRCHLMYGEQMGSSLPRPRPRFELTSSLTAEEILMKVDACLQEDPKVVGAVFSPDRIEVTIGEGQHIWSPQLAVVINPTDEGKSHLCCRFGPHPHIWTLYVALYALFIILAIASASFGVAQLSADKTPYALFLAPASLVLAGLVYGGAYVGQGLGTDQMYQLRTFLAHCLER